MEIKDIILIFLIFAIIYLLYKTRKLENVKAEGFEANSDAINKAINDQYKVDIDAIRNLAQISKKIMDNKDNLTLPTNITIPGTTDITGNTHIKGSLIIDGDINFSRKDINKLEIFPRYMIMAWYGKIPKDDTVGLTNSPPLGWAVCDGNKYLINSTTGIAEQVIMTNKDGIKTPDLRGRFILGSGIVTGDNRNNSYDGFGGNSYERDYTFLIGETGGQNKHQLIEDEMPKHIHNFGRDYWTSTLARNKGVDLGSYENQFANDASGETTSKGGDKPHNNMPPYYSLYYIMKI
jgi:microcystin-dependent protein